MTEAGRGLFDSTTERPIRVLLVDGDEARLHALGRALAPNGLGRFELSWEPDIATAADAMDAGKHDVAVVAVVAVAALGTNVAAGGGSELGDRMTEWPLIVLGQPGSALDRPDALRRGAVDFLSATELDQPEVVQRSIRYAVDRARSRQAYEDVRDQFRDVVEGTRDGFWDWNLESGRVRYGAGWLELLGLSEGDVSGSPFEWMVRVHPSDRAEVQAAVEEHIEGRTEDLDHEHRIEHVDGTFRWVRARGSVVRDPDGRALRLVGALTDITRVRRAEEQLAFARQHDDLTRLPNRARLTALLESEAARPPKGRSLLMLDVDGLRVVNESFGREAGDELLIIVAERLRRSVRATDTVARLDGDEFAVLLESVADSELAREVAVRLQDALRAPVSLGGQAMIPTVSVGIAVDEHVEEGRDLIGEAGSAMYQATGYGKSRCVVFDRDAREEASAMLQLDTDLHLALERDEFEVHYQPIVALGDHHVVSLEALVRWRHPQRGLLPPAEFIGHAERTGLIVDIDHWVLAEVVRQSERWWRSSGPAGWPAVSVNLSGVHFSHQETCRIEEALDAARLPPGWIGIELTEGVLIERRSSVTDLLQRLRARKVRLSVDDFGSGYSSLGYLQHLPVDALKIGREFVVGLETDAAGRDIVRNVVTLARDLGLSLVAEGIEHPDQAELLRELGCGFGQGFLFSRAVVPGKVAALLDR